MVNRYSFIFLLCLMQVSCFGSNQQQECLTSDSVAVIDILSLKENKYYLVHRISGWHNKMENFEVYNTKPIFNDCGESLIQPLLGESIDTQDANNNDQHVVHVYFTPPDEFILDYAIGPLPDVDYNKTLSIELH